MNWEEFQIEKEYCRKAWEALKAGYTEEGLSRFLKKSYLVVAFKWQFGIDDDLITAAKECPRFFVNEGVTSELLDIAKKIKFQESLKTIDKEELEDLKFEANDFDKKSIRVVDDWYIAPIFPSVNMDYIQRIKGSPYCDQERTIMRAYSIVVVLKKIKNL